METPLPMGGCVGGWVGVWMVGWVGRLMGGVR